MKWYPFLSPECTISLLPQEHGPVCPPSTLLHCSFCDLSYARFEEFASDGNRFNVLTPNYILHSLDYEVVVSVGVYALRITNLERHNYSRYRCYGYDDTFSKVYSDEWKLLTACEGVHVAAFVAGY